jgi:hypothetical protein
LALVLRRWPSLKSRRVLEETWGRRRASLPLRCAAFALCGSFTLYFSLHHLLLHLTITRLLGGRLHPHEELLSPWWLRCCFGALH